MVFTTLFNILRTCAFLLILEDYFRRNYEYEYNLVIIKVSVHGIYAISKCQILFNKIQQRFIEYTSDKPILKNALKLLSQKNIRMNEICQIKNDEIHTSYYSKDTKYFEDDHDKNTIYVFSDNEKGLENRSINKIILNPLTFKTSSYEQIFNASYEQSNIQFMLLEIKLQDNTYKIDLKTDSYNYYIVGNILDKMFFTYYLRNYHIVDIADKSNLEYMKNSDSIFIKLIDHEVNVRELEITDKKYITIQKDNYDY